MPFKLSSLAFLALLLFQGCATSKSATSNSVLWVSGVKTNCSAGAGEMMCLNVHRGEDLSDPEWELLYAGIEGFEFEEGVMKKIEVKTQQLDAKSVPADASTVKYTLVKELEQQADYRSLLGGDWLLTRLNDQPIDRSTVLPTLDISLADRRISGNGGCNNYFGTIEKLTPNTLNLTGLGSTKKACRTRHIENDYLAALGQVNTYQIKGNNLIMYSAEGNKILSFMKQVRTAPDQRLHDIWAAVRIEGNPINRMVEVPRLEIDLKERQLRGSDGCNQYFGPFKQLTATAFVPATLSVTEKYCQQMEVPERYHRALAKVTSYELDQLMLLLKDENGQEVLAFRKVD